MELTHFNAQWNYPTSIRVGLGRIAELGACCKELGIQSPLMVTDPGLAELDIVRASLEICRDAGINCGLFARIKSNPSGENVSDGVAALLAGGHDGVIAFGGGSALDAGKAIALMAGQNRPLWDFEDVGDNWKRVNTQGMLPVIAVPTTSGTGSEVGRASVISDEQQQLKRIIFHPHMLPKIVLLDAQLTTGLPAKLTAATGMDALSHALEAYCAPGYHPMAEGIALEAIRLIKDFLPSAVANGSDLVARAQVMTASTMGATAFQRGLGGMHALAHPIGALYDSHHGMLNAILMPYVLVANRSVIEQPIQRLSRYLNLPASSFDAFLNWVLELRAGLNIPHSLSALGVDAAKARQIAQMAVDDPCAGSNPIRFSAEQYHTIFLAAVSGEL